MGFYFSLCRHRYREASHLPHGFQCQSLSSSPIKRCSSDSLTNKRIKRDVELRVVSTKTSNKNLCWVEEITPGLDISSPFLPHDTFKDIFLKWVLLNHVRGTPRCHPTFQELRRFFLAYTHGLQCNIKERSHILTMVDSASRSDRDCHGVSCAT